jgi:Spy/CpxP family protein refolding chaperone
MKRPFIIFSLILSFIAFGAFTASAQESEGPPPNEQQRPPNRMDLLRELGLQPQQIRQIRQLNVGIRERRMSAQKALREVTGALDDAIYADTIDEAVVAQRLSNVQSAQAEIAKINFENEIAVRRILTPEQLVRFREIRSAVEQRVRENFQRRRQGDGPGMRMQRPGSDRPVSRPVQNPAQPVRKN